MLGRGLTVAALAALIPCLAHADDINSLAAEYKAALGKLGGAPRDRHGKVEANVKPVVERIAALGTKEATAFLQRELESAPFPEVQGAVAGALVAKGDPKTAEAVVAGLSRRPPQVQAAVLGVLADGGADLKPLEEGLVRLAAGRVAGEARGDLIAVLGKLDTVAAAKALLGLVPPHAGAVPTGSTKIGAAKGGADEDVGAKVVAALKGTKSDEVRGWLAKGAFAAGAPEALRTAARVAGELGLEDARPELKKLVDHRSPEVAGAAIAALARIGVGDAADEVASALKKLGKTDVSLRIEALDALAGAKSSEALKVVIEAARGKDVETRTIALGALARAASNAEALDALTDALGDDESVVRSVALRSLASVREKAMVGPIIAALESTKDDSFRVKLVELLYNTTGQNFGLEVEDWRKWWGIAGDRFEFPKDVAKGATFVKSRGLEYFGLEISSKRLAFVLDVSGSMREEVAVQERQESAADGGEKNGKGGATSAPDPKPAERGKRDARGKPGRAMKIDVLKRELVRVLGKLPADTLLNLVTFDGTPKTWQDNLQPIAGAGRARVISYVQGLNTGSGTNVYDSLELILSDRRVDTVYLLTDGLPTRGKFVGEDDILREIVKINRTRGATIHAIAFGAESEFLKKLAEQNGGEYRFVDSF